MTELANKMYEYYYNNFLNVGQVLSVKERSIEYGMLKAINLMLFLNDEISKDIYLDMCNMLRTTAESYGILEPRGNKKD